MARWVVGAGCPPSVDVGGEVQQFARTHGMAAEESGIVGVLVSAAILEAEQREHEDPSCGPVLVDAATDGEDLSVRTLMSGRGPLHGAHAHFEFRM